MTEDKDKDEDEDGDGGGGTSLVELSRVPYTWGMMCELETPYHTCVEGCAAVAASPWPLLPGVWRMSSPCGRERLLPFTPRW